MVLQRQESHQQQGDKCLRANLAVMNESMDQNTENIAANQSIVQTYRSALACHLACHILQGNRMNDVVGAAVGAIPVKLSEPTL